MQDGLVNGTPEIGVNGSMITVADEPPEAVLSLANGVRITATGGVGNSNDAKHCRQVILLSGELPPELVGKRGEKMALECPKGRGDVRRLLIEGGEDAR